MTAKARRDWRSWGMYPGRKYYVVAAGRPEHVDEDSLHYIHYIETADGNKVMCVFSTLRKAKRFIRKSLEGDPTFYLDLLEDSGGTLPTGLRNGEYTVIPKTPDGLAEMGLKMGIHGLVLDPGPGENYPIPLSARKPGLDPDSDYYVLRFGRGLEAGRVFHYANHRGKEVLPIFTSEERMVEFVEEHTSVNTGHLNILRRDRVDNFKTPKRSVVGALLKSESDQVLGGKLTPVLETLPLIADALGTDYLVINPGKPDSCYLALSSQAA